MDQQRPEISTNVRPTSWALTWLAARLAPRWLEERAFAAWRRPRRPARPREPGAAGARAFRFEVGEGALAAWEWNAAGPAGTAVLVHGWSGTAAHLDSFVAPLASAGFHVLAVDLPAHGQSPGRFATVVSLAHAVAELCTRVQPSVVVAHSLGATATTYALTRGLALQRVVLLAPPVELPPYLAHFARAAGLSAELQARLLARTERHVGFPLDELDLRRHAPRLGTTRALVVHDADDAVVPVASGAALARAWPGAQFLETSGLGHDRLRRAPAVVAAAVAFATEPPAHAPPPPARSEGPRPARRARGLLAAEETP